jgi:MscS family membrane protein
MSRPTHARLRFFAFGLFALALALAHAVPAEQLTAPAPVPTPAPQDEAAADPYGRDTPQGCFFGFLRATEKGSYANAAEYLQIPPSLKPQREQVAAQFQEVLDQRFVSTSLERLSRSPRGTIEDGLPPNVERVGEILGPDGSFDVLLVRHEPAGAPPIWLISWETIREARQIYGELGAPVVARQLPEFLVHTRIGPLRLWQIAAFLLLLPVLYGFSWLLIRGIFALVHLVRRKPETGPTGEWAASARSPATLLIALLLHRIAVFWLGIPVMYRVYYNRFLYVLLLFILLWMLLRIVDVVDRHLLRRVMPAGRTTGGPSLSLVRRALRGVAFVLVALLALPVFGVNVTATLAGLGIGGLVLAFAAQKSLENVFGGFAILADRPLSVGDTCRIGGQLGEVEDITLWATRLRTNERTVVSIPNGAVMTGQIENLTRRDKFWFHPTVSVAYETTVAQMSVVLAQLRGLLAADPRVEKEGSRVRFARLGDSSLDIDVFAYVRVSAYSEFLAVQEELLLRVLEIVEAAGTSVAFPSHTVYLRSDAPPDRAPDGRGKA